MFKVGDNMKKKLLYMFSIIVVFTLSFNINVYAKSITISDFVDDISYVNDAGKLTINQENAVSWTNKFLSIKYNPKKDSDEDAKELARVYNELYKRIDPKNKNYSADIYSALGGNDANSLVNQIYAKGEEWQKSASKAGKDKIANKFKTVNETTGSETKKNTEERKEQEEKNKNTLTGENTYAKSSTIYKRPEKNTTKNAGDSLDDMMSDGEAFIENGTVTYDQTKLTNVSNTIYNILLTVGVIMAVLVGAILGIKLMVSGVEQKVEAKKLLVPYVAGCIVIFGGFGIWKLVVTILQGI